jgi:hypothetical protein
MFRRFLDAAGYRFGYSDDSSTGSYGPVRECCVVIANNPANAIGAVGDSPRGPLKQLGNPHLKPATSQSQTRLA